jgi:hypothetical protein
MKMNTAKQEKRQRKEARHLRLVFAEETPMTKDDELSTTAYL